MISIYPYALWLLHCHFDDLVQDCSNSSALAMELLQSCTKPSIWHSSNQTKHKDTAHILRFQCQKQTGI